MHHQPVPAEWDWPDSLDALTAAPRHHELLFEDDRVRVLRTTIPAGEIVPLHTHRCGGVVYIFSWSDFIRRDERGNVLLDTRQSDRTPSPGTVLPLESLPPHSVENVGNGEICTLNIETKYS